MKILVVSNFYPPDCMGGYEMGCRDAVEALEARGHDVLVLSAAPRGPVPSEPKVRRALRLTDIWDEYSFREGSLDVARLDQVRARQIDAFNVHALLDAIADFQPDAVYLWMTIGIGGLGLLAAIEHMGIPWVWHLMDDVPSMLCRVDHAVVPALAREFERIAEQGSFLACSRRLVDEIDANGPRLLGRVEIVPNWIAGPRRSSRKNYKTDGILRMVTASARLDRRNGKGIDLVLEAAALLRERGCERFRLDVHGLTVDPWFEDFVQRRGLAGHVRFQGAIPREELRERFVDYDLFVFATHAREPFAFAPLEAAERGCVPVFSDICGNAEWFVHGVHCLKAARTAPAFADALERAFAPDFDLANLGRRAAAVVRRDFHLDAVVLKIERALAKAAQRARNRKGTAEETYRAALLAEKLAAIWIYESSLPRSA